VTERLTRRGTIALLGTLAGCSGTNPLSSESTATELDAPALRSLVDDPAPALPRRLPVDIGTDHLAASERRARTLLDAVPATIESADIPNGAIRERTRRARDRAADSLAAAAAARTPFERLHTFGDARTDARFAAGAWRAIDAGLTRQDLDAAADAVREDRHAIRERWRYVGDDPVDAVLVHAAIERRIDSGRSDVDTGDSRRYRPGNPLGVGELAEDVERARVAVDDAAHLYDRLRASLDDPTDVRGRLIDARTRLRETFETERETLTSVDSREPWRVEGVDVEDTPAAEALAELYRPVDPAHDDGWGDTTPARAVTRAHESLVTLAAFTALRDRMREGETFAVESIEDVARARTAAVEALRWADANPSVPPLTRWSLATLADQFGYADDRLGDTEGGVRTARLRDPVSTYLVVMARARAVPSASERVASALRTA
jgi:hypothetical protein